MKHQSYFTRAMRANDPRYARVFGKLGYDTAALQTADAPTTPDDEAELKVARDDYQVKVGKKPFHGWSADELREKIAAHEKG